MLLYLLVCVLLPGQGARAEPVGRVKPDGLQVTDDLGQEVRLEAPARRIISLAPHLTELLFELGVGDRIMGTVRYSDYPAAAKDLPRLGDAFSVSVESIVSLAPDVVFAWQSGGANRALERLQALGVVIYLNESPRLLDIGEGVRKIAHLVGEDQRGNVLADAFDRRLGMLQRTQGKGSPRVFFQISDQNLYTVTDQHLIGQAINWCGGLNVFGEAPVPVPQVSLEAVLAGRPDLIVMTRVPGSPVPEWAPKWDRYPWLRGRVRFIDPNLISRPGLRMQEGISQLCESIADQASPEGAGQGNTI